MENPQYPPEWCRMAQKIELVIRLFSELSQIMMNLHWRSSSSRIFRHEANGIYALPILKRTRRLYSQAQASDSVWQTITKAPSSLWSFVTFSFGDRFWINICFARFLAANPSVTVWLELVSVPIYIANGITFVMNKTILYPIVFSVWKSVYPWNCIEDF